MGDFNIRGNQINGISIIGNDNIIVYNSKDMQNTTLNKLTPSELDAVIDIIGCNQDRNSPIYFSGPDMVSIFRSLDIDDFYDFTLGQGGKGIVTQDIGENLSRKQYIQRRLGLFNRNERIVECIQRLVDKSKSPKNLVKQLEEIIPRFKGRFYYSDDSYLCPIPNKGTIQIFPQDPKTISQLTKNGIAPYSINNYSENQFSVFISYSWDSESHKQWVQKLANDLKSNGINAIYDQDLPYGMPLPDFMKNSIKQSDKVLIIGTPKYLQRSLTKGAGCQFEDYIITEDIYEKFATTKFIPILRSGTFSTSFPFLIANRKGMDFSDDNQYENRINELIKHLLKTASHN